MSGRPPIGHSFSFHSAVQTVGHTLRAGFGSSPAPRNLPTAVVVGQTESLSMAAGHRQFAASAGCGFRLVSHDDIGSRRRGDGIVLVPLEFVEHRDLSAAIRSIRAAWPGVGILGTYAKPQVRAIVEAMRAGLDDCISLDAADADSIGTVRRWIERAMAGDADVVADDPVPEIKVEVPEMPAAFVPFVTADTRLRGRLTLLNSAAASDETILLQGPTGTGKTLLASLVHQASRRSRAPFVEVSCAALSPTLLESELFGHIRGAYTGATTDSPGKVGTAHSGTLFLDEIDSLPPGLQGKLLRLLQSRMYEPVGSHQTKTADVRFIAATNADLRERIVEGGFRADLYYRLSVVRFELPALAERGDDIVELAEHLLRDACDRIGRCVTGIEPAAIAAIRRYAWPGNVRELENAIRCAVLSATDTQIALSDLPPELRGGDRQPRTDALKRRVEETERSTIEDALRRTGNCRTDAAAALGITRITLYNKMKKLGIT